MKTLIILFGVSFALAYVQQYRGFDECGVDGWSCDYAKGKYNITYRCPSDQPDARIWIWTARLPAGVSSWTVRDCHHLEVHIECPKGLRTSILRQFNVINVTDLDFLPPTGPGYFLHDNDQIPQAPPIMHIQDVRRIRFYSGIFDKPGGGCRYKFLELTSISFVNVHINKIMKDLFHNQNLDKFVMRDVVIDSIENNAITISANTCISKTYFPHLPKDAISIKGENISFVNNTFQKILTLGLLVRSREFKFSNNYVEEIGFQGLDAMGAKIDISGNTFYHLDTGALQKISPGYSPLSYEIASKFMYNFSDNNIKNFSPGSMHLNWENYKKICSEIIFENNIFDCSCTNLGWMSVSNGLGPKISKVREFYDRFLNTECNKCKGYNNCPLNKVTAQIQKVCNNNTNISEICASKESIISNDLTTFPDGIDLTESLSNKAEDITQPLKTDPQEITEKVMPLLPYTENQTSHKESGDFNIWFIVIPLKLILAATLIGIFIWWYKKKKQRQLVTTIYKNEKSADADNLIIINEHHNELYDKQ